MRAALRRFLPKPLLAAYHGLLAQAAAAWYRHPTRELVVIGITGTSGKTSTSMLLRAILERAGYPTAVATTALFAIRDRSWANATKMTMLGRFALQRFLDRARRAGCTHAIVETTSEGLAQNRHRGIDYDVAVLTNLTPEHLESHGSFTAYQQAKERLFHALTLTERKPRVSKTIVVNADDSAAPAFLRHAADRYLTFSQRGTRPVGMESVLAYDVRLEASGSQFELEFDDAQVAVRTRLLGNMNVENCLAAAAIACALGVPLPIIAEGIAAVEGIPGRLEVVSGGGVVAVVDYAFHRKAMEELYAVVDQLPHGRIFHVLGGTGGGRDRARRPVLGRIAAERADVVIVTNEDPYDEDPFAIMDDVLKGVLGVNGKKMGENVFSIYDRYEAISKAVGLAVPGDLLLVTGKGSESAIVVAGGKKVPWDDREAVRSALKQRFSSRK